MLQPSLNLKDVDVIPKDEIEGIIKKASLKYQECATSSAVFDLSSETEADKFWKIIATTAFTQWVIDPNRVAGKGQSEVVLAQNLISKQWAAVKIMKPNTISFDDDVANEKKLLIKCNRFIGDAKDSQGIVYLLMPYYFGMDLQKYLYTTNSSIPKDQPGHFAIKNDLPVLKMARLVANVIKEVIALHKMGIAHRDLKLENLLLNDINEHFDVKLIDLGTGIDLSGRVKERVTDIAGTFGYNDPVLSDREHGRQPYRFQNDFASLGIIIAAICSKSIYPDKLRIKLAEQKAKGQKSELTLEEIKSMMPDMFASPPAPASVQGESILAKTERALMDDIRWFTNSLTFEPIEARPDLSKLEQKYIEFQSKVARAWLEALWLNPVPLSLAHTRAASGRIASRACLVSPRTSLGGTQVAASSPVTSPRSSVNSSDVHIRRRTGIFFLHEENFAYASSPAPAAAASVAATSSSGSPAQSPRSPVLSKSFRVADHYHPSKKSEISKASPRPMPREPIAFDTANLNRAFIVDSINNFLTYLSLKQEVLTMSDKTSVALLIQQLRSLRDTEDLSSLATGLKNLLHMVDTSRVSKQSKMEPILARMRIMLTNCFRGPLILQAERLSRHRRSISWDPKPTVEKDNLVEGVDNLTISASQQKHKKKVGNPMN